MTNPRERIGGNRKQMAANFKILLCKCLKKVYHFSTGYEKKNTATNLTPWSRLPIKQHVKMISTKINLCMIDKLFLPASRQKRKTGYCASIIWTSEINSVADKKLVRIAPALTCDEEFFFFFKRTPDCRLLLSSSGINLLESLEL